MYIIKNAFKCIGRSRGRNILIGVIVFVIAVSACIGLSIRQAAENAKSETLEGLTVTATISFDRQKTINDMMSEEIGDISENGRPSFDRDKFSDFSYHNILLSENGTREYFNWAGVSGFDFLLSFWGQNYGSPPSKRRRQRLFALHLNAQSLKQSKIKSPPAGWTFCFGRSVGIRTRGLLDPNQARYQTSPHPVKPSYYNEICFLCQALLL